MTRSKRIALCGVLTALALALSLAERMLPVQLVVPIPGIKLGLANVVTMFALLFLSFREAASILVCRVILASVFAGSVTAFAFSMTGGLFALMTTWLLLHRRDRWFSMYGISAAAAAMHNVGQICAGIVIMQSVNVIAYLPLLLVSAIPMGFLTGAMISLLAENMKHARLVDRWNTAKN